MCSKSTRSRERDERFVSRRRIVSAVTDESSSFREPVRSGGNICEITYARAIQWAKSREKLEINAAWKRARRNNWRTLARKIGGDQRCGGKPATAGGRYNLSHFISRLMRQEKNTESRGALARHTHTHIYICVHVTCNTWEKRAELIEQNEQKGR